LTIFKYFLAFKRFKTFRTPSFSHCQIPEHFLRKGNCLQHDLQFIKVIPILSLAQVDYTYEIHFDLDNIPSPVEEGNVDHHTLHFQA